MIKYPISKDYIAHWSIYDAIREIFQNAIDNDYDLNKDTFRVHYTNKTLVIKNEGELTRQSLLLGNSSKNDNHIGKYGEGYKLASLVLARNNKLPEIHSGSNLFAPKIIFDKEFESDILVISEQYCFNPNHTTFYINNITADEYDKIVINSLFLQEYDKILTEGEEILLQPQHKGNIYVKGLYVCNDKTLSYGYNFDSSSINLNRDRNLASELDITYASSRLWMQLSKYYESLFLQLIDDNSKDVQYCKYHRSNNINKIDQIAINFVESNPKAIPISTQNERNELIKQGYVSENIVIVPKNKKELIKSSSYYKQREPTVKRSYSKKIKPITILTEYQLKFKSNLTDEMNKDLNEIIELSRKWRMKETKDENLF